MKSLLRIACFWIAAAPAFADDLRHPSTLNSFCIDPDRDQLCALFPNDQTDFSDKFVYMFINVETQSRFDVFSWQGFTALHWPETGRNSPDPVKSWGEFRRREEIFANDRAMAACGAYAAGADVITADVTQADGNVLVDVNGNFIVYETRLNDVAEAYIRAERLNTQSGLTARGDAPISFPQGAVGNAATPASVLVKTSWQILPPDANTNAYIVKQGLIHIPASLSETGEDLCLREPLGMIGMHIVARTQSGNGDEWLWSTFEHRRSAPTAGNARRVNAIFAKDLFPGGCSAPDDAADHILYNAAFVQAPTNQTITEWGWAATAPYARISGAMAPPPQIVRCWEVFEGTRELNEIWQAELSGTPLANYQLISTQWRGADESPMFEHGEVPRFLTNTTMETYLQAEREGSCLGCHAEAETAIGGDGNFTFLFEMAQED